MKTISQLERENAEMRRMVELLKTQLTAALDLIAKTPQRERQAHGR